MNHLITYLEKYGFLLVFLFCFGFFTPDLTSKLGLMFDDSNVIEDGAKSSVIKQLFWLLMFSFFSLRLFKYRGLMLSKPVQHLIVVLFCICFYAIVTALWSDFPSLTLKRAIFQMLFCFTVIVSFYFACYHDTLTRCMTLACYAILVLITVSFLNGTAFDRVGSLAGFSRGKNILGQNLLVLLGVLALCSQHTIKLNKKLIFLSVIFFLLLLLTKSKTSIFIFLTFLLLMKTSNVFRQILVAASFFSLVVVFIVLPVLSAWLSHYTHIAMVLSPEAITGRGMIWDLLYFDLQYFDKLGFGYGYSSYFNTGTTPYLFDEAWSFLSRINSTHNGFIDILVQFGFWGSAFIVSSLVYLYATANDKSIIPFFIIPLMYNITEATFLRDQNMMWLFILLLFASSRVNINPPIFPNKVLHQGRCNS